MRTRLPASARREILADALNFCANPKCFVENGLEVHHINHNHSSNHYSNLIALCPTCHHVRCHRLGERGFSDGTLRYFKELYINFVPGKRNSLSEIEKCLGSYYVLGNFQYLEDAILVLFKALRRSNFESQWGLIGRLHEYLGEIGIQRGKGYGALKHLSFASRVFSEHGLKANAFHVAGLLALGHGQAGFPKQAALQIDEAIGWISNAATDSFNDHSIVGWLHHLRATTHRALGSFRDAFEELYAAEEAYNLATERIPSRELAQIPLERIKLLVEQGGAKNAFEAETLLSNVSLTLLEHGWASEKASLHLQQYYLCRLKNEKAEANVALTCALEAAISAESIRRVLEILDILESDPIESPRIHAILTTLHSGCPKCQKEPYRSAACIKLQLMASGLGIIGKYDEEQNNHGICR